MFVFVPSVPSWCAYVHHSGPAHTSCLGHALLQGTLPPSCPRTLFWLSAAGLLLRRACLCCRLTMSRARDRNIVSRGAQTGRASWVSETQVTGHPQDALAGGNQMSHALAAVEAKTVPSSRPFCTVQTARPVRAPCYFPSLGLGCPTLPPASPQLTLQGGHCDVKDRE